MQKVEQDIESTIAYYVLSGDLKPDWTPWKTQNIPTLNVKSHAVQVSEDKERGITNWVHKTTLKPTFGKRQKKNAYKDWPHLLCFTIYTEKYMRDHGVIQEMTLSIGENTNWMNKHRYVRIKLATTTGSGVYQEVRPGLIALIEYEGTMN